MRLQSIRGTRLCRALAVIAAFALAAVLIALPAAPPAAAQSTPSPDGLTAVDLADESVIEFLAPTFDITAQLVGDTINVSFGTAGGPLDNGLAFTVPGGFAPPPASYFSGDGTVTSLNAGVPFCTSGGPFEILDLVAQPGGAITSLAIDFFSTCQNLRGSIRINTQWGLDQRTFIAGFVTDEATGLPLEGISVCAYDSENQRFCVLTESDGFYAMAGIPANYYGVTFYDPEGRGYAGECFRDSIGCANTDNFKSLKKHDFINVSTVVSAELGPGCGWDEATIVGSNAAETLVGTAGDDVIMGLGGDDIIRGNGGNDTVCGGGGDDRVTTIGGRDILFGGPGNDVILSGGGDDFLYGGSGRDRLTAGSGADVLRGGLDVDYLRGQDGADILLGEGGSDRLWGGVGNDQLEGDSGADRMWGGDGNDEMLGQGGQDQMWGGPGNDTMQGNHQSDVMYGGTGDDDMRAAKGKDTLYGDDGIDILFGGDNTDQLDGGAGADDLNGGRGSDTCAPDNTDTRTSCAVGTFN